MLLLLYSYFLLGLFIRLLHIQALWSCPPDTSLISLSAINEEDAKKFQKMLDLLDDDDDVQEVYHNAEFPEGWEE